MGKGGIRVCGGDITELKPHLPQRSINTVKTGKVQNSSRSRWSGDMMQVARIQKSDSEAFRGVLLGSKTGIM